MAKRKEKIPTAKELGEELIDRYTRWSHIYHHGCSDPTWEDGVNINLVRNHILIAKKNIEKYLGDNFSAYPDYYFFPEPMQLTNDFMAVERRLGCRGKLLPATKTLPYEEVMKFDWGEVLCLT